MFIGDFGSVTRFINYHAAVLIGNFDRTIPAIFVFEQHDLGGGFNNSRVSFLTFKHLTGHVRTTDTNCSY